ncbi:MAG: Holliday junction branch migration DNA helicase RuvB [Patescibacteria group bacterium]|mgnify:CR=1 FL=1
MKKTVNRTQDDKYIDSLLRPNSWQEYIGQEKIKKSLKIILGAAKKRKESSDHLLFYGQPGLGKTTLAVLVAKEMGANLKTVSGPNIEKTGDLAALLSNLETRDILFIDEAHRLRPEIEEILYPAMESRKIYLTIGKGPSSRIVALDLPPFTLIAATTRINLLSSPLRSRFGATFKFDYYGNEDIEKIILHSAEVLGINILESAVAMIAKASRFTPRTANRLLKRSRDVAEIKNNDLIDQEIVKETFHMLEIDEMGLEWHDRRLLEVIIKKFKGGPVGVGALSAILGEEKGVIEEVYEPYLLKTGLIQRTPHGRKASLEAYKWLGELKQTKLIH